LRRCPSPSKPHVLAKKGTKNAKNETLARSMLPNKLTQRGRPYHFFLYKCKPLQAKKEAKTYQNDEKFER
jgi:hypothetical protein